MRLEVWNIIEKEKESRTICKFVLEPPDVKLVSKNHFEINRARIQCNNLPAPDIYLSEIEIDSIPGPDFYDCETIVFDNKIVILFDGNEDDINFFMSLRIFNKPNPRKVYIDMDGTLVDFVSKVNKCGYWRKDKTNKVDWDKVIADGPEFWAEMDWMPGAEDAFKELQIYAAWGLFDLYILSSIDFDEGVEGKKAWIQINTTFPLENAIFVLEPEYKDQYANPDSFLIDDRKKSLEPFAAAGGNAIEFTGMWGRTIDYLIDLIMGEKYENR